MATMKVGSSLGVGGAPGAQREDDELARYLQGTVGLEEVLQPTKSTSTKSAPLIQIMLRVCEFAFKPLIIFMIDGINGIPFPFSCHSIPLLSSR